MGAPPNTNHLGKVAPTDLALRVRRRYWIASCVITNRDSAGSNKTQTIFFGMHFFNYRVEVDM